MSQIVASAVSAALRSVGLALELSGRALQVNPYVETVQKSSRIIKLKNVSPTIQNAFVASNASVIGKVSIGKHASVWYGALIKGDTNNISIGNASVICDRAMINSKGKCKSNPSGSTTNIGNSVFIGAGAMINSCAIEDGAVIGENVQLMDGVKVGKNAKISAGSFVPAGLTIGSGELWSGAPAKLERNLTPTEIEANSNTITEYIELAGVHAEESAKSWLQVECDVVDYYDELYRGEFIPKRQTESDISKRDFEINFHQFPGRIFDSNLRKDSVYTQEQYDALITPNTESPKK